MRLRGNKRLFIVGPMAVGKTTIGKLLADALGLSFVDSDHEIESRAGTNVAWIFDVEGEDAFRDRESKVIDDITNQCSVLLATGGGSVLRQENRDKLAERGVVIFLDTNVETQLKRTAKDTKRPLLQTGNPRAVLTQLKIERDPLYTEVADIRVFVGNAGSKKTVNSILQKLRKDGYLED